MSGVEQKEKKEKTFSKTISYYYQRYTIGIIYDVISSLRVYISSRDANSQREIFFHNIIIVKLRILS